MFEGSDIQVYFVRLMVAFDYRETIESFAEKAFE